MTEKEEAEQEIAIKALPPGAEVEVFQPAVMMGGDFAAWVRGTYQGLHTDGRPIVRLGKSHQVVAFSRIRLHGER